MSRPETIPSSSERHVAVRGPVLGTLRRGSLFVLSICLLTMGRATLADDGVEFFEKKIRPVLVKHCYECHSASSTEVEGGLRLDSREAMRAGGDTGPAVVPHNAEESVLLDAIRHETLEMPPDERLSDAIIADFEVWIAMGAPDPRDRAPTAAEAAELSWQATLEARRQWWSLQPVVAPDVPDVTNGDWSDHSIDRFVLNKLESADLSPAEPADARTLIRRLSLVLIGLPPAPAETEAFLVQYSADPEAAYNELIERMLGSTHFGERWARHWMDVVRFTETHGNEWNYEVHHAWRYRDYLIRAFNDDVPFDQLIREHIAGDLLPEPRYSEQENINESVIGTAFYRFGEANHDDCIGLRSIGFDLADNRIDTLTKAFQATTVACARCHDHKMDAVSTKDYYALLGILRSSRLVAQTIDSPTVNAKPMRRLDELKTAIHKEIASRWLDDTGDVARYLIAADAARNDRADAATLAAGLDAARVANWVTALKVEDPSLDHPLSLWLALHGDDNGDDNDDDEENVVVEMAEAWRQQSDRYASEHEARRKFNDESFLTYGDFRTGGCGQWKTTGHGLRQGPTAAGDFCVASEGESVIGAVLPAGLFTHTLSEKLNGALRSPFLHDSKKHISFHVLGDHTSAVRLVSNNCQLNYKNYHALTDSVPGWITFSPPDDGEGVRVYAELMTKFDNPKFPDQLGTLGGDTQDDRVPWDEAAADPRSYWGVTHVVMHDCDETPKPQLDHLLGLFAGDETGSPQTGTPQTAAPQTLADVAQRYADVINRAILAWSEDRATDADVRWLDWLVRGGLLDNSPQQTSRLAELVTQYRAIQQSLSVPRIAPGVEDIDGGFEQAVLVRGDCMTLGEVVPRRYLEVLAGDGQMFKPSGSGRLELAELIASPENPLTARVIVNRVWHHLFGTGIVKSVDDFGHVGEPPSHPELLDYLATRFVEQDWSIKRLIREIVETKTFRMTGRAASLAHEIDPENRLLHHYPVRRLDAEAIRDSILLTSGRLDPALFGLSVEPYRDEAVVDRRLFPGSLDGGGRRSLYTKVRLMEGAKFLGAFNVPGGKVTQGRRDVTNVPAQALALLNDPFVIQQAEVWSERLVQLPEDAVESRSVESRIEDMFLQALGRPPTAEEAEEFGQLVRYLADFHQVKTEETLANPLIWKDVAHVVFNLKEFIYVP